jgi:hypothetical protein
VSSSTRKLSRDGIWEVTVLSEYADSGRMVNGRLPPGDARESRTPKIKNSVSRRYERGRATVRKPPRSGEFDPYPL